MWCSSSAAGYFCVEQIVERALEDRGGAVVALEDLARHFAGAEARDLRVANQLAERSILRRGEFFRRDADLELDLRWIERLQRRGHEYGRPPEAGTAGKSPPSFELERKTRFELATLALARRCSTAELLPRTAGPAFARAGTNPRSLPNPARAVNHLGPGPPARRPERSETRVRPKVEPSWARRDSNSDGSPHWNLNPARLPISPRARWARGFAPGGCDTARSASREAAPAFG